MKRIFTLITLAFICNALAAQEKVDATQLIDDICQNRITINELKTKYKNNIQVDESGKDEQLGMLNINNITFAGFESKSIVMINPNVDMRLIIVMPDYDSLDSLSRYQSADACHKYMIETLGAPFQEEDTALDVPMLQEIAGKMNIQGGKTYSWVSVSGIPYIALRLKTDKEDYYAVMIMMTPPQNVTTIPIQRKFFKTLEFGKQVTKFNIATALEVNSYSISEERNSSGKTYNYWKSVYFGGIEWSFVEIRTVEGEMCAINLTDSQLKDNKYVYDSLLEALTKKYGEPNADDKVVAWSDGKTVIELSHTYGESKGGEMRYYVDIRYTDIELFRKSQNIISNEL